jgi:hypothetical protein
MPQLLLFGPPPPPTGEGPPCLKCGHKNTVISPGVGPHHARINCPKCGAWRWLPKPSRESRIENPGSFAQDQNRSENENTRPGKSGVSLETGSGLTEPAVYPGTGDLNERMSHSDPEQAQ